MTFECDALYSSAFMLMSIEHLEKIQSELMPTFADVPEVTGREGERVGHQGSIHRAEAQVVQVEDACQGRDEDDVVQSRRGLVVWSDSGLVRLLPSPLPRACAQEINRKRKEGGSYWMSIGPELHI